MLRQSLKAALIVFALASLVQDAQGKGRCNGRVANYFFGGYGTGPFGYGYFPYAGWNGNHWGCVQWYGYARYGYGYGAYRSWYADNDPADSDDSSPPAVASHTNAKQQSFRK